MIRSAPTNLVEQKPRFLVQNGGFLEPSLLIFDGYDVYDIVSKFIRQDSLRISAGKIIRRYEGTNEGKASN